ncbi:glutathione peroxidase [uncultured Ruminococcus sp.]|uniref:glutathione peroxidase n=1 Tax=uncultured Ruminococcus sp. TaxID=165186 RepID=UPI0025E3620A|nr:glutathione peroxidase [uncultured Ruminococcus sp.]
MSIYDHKVNKRREGQLDMAEMKGKVMLIVNTATGCGFTPQYEGLEKLYESYHDKGLEVLDFPCNQFGNQAPGDDAEIHQFCTAKYKTQFDQLAKIEVNGENECPVYTYLKANSPAERVDGIKNKAIMKSVEKLSKSCKAENDIKWNFTKFLVDREGSVVGRYSPTCAPKDIEEDIKKIL